jgi:hypothetical protein
MYQTFFKTVMTEEQFIQANLTACQELAERFQDTNAVQKIRTIRESELEQQNMSILLPFYLLKLRKRVVAAKSSEQLRVLSGSLKVLVEALTQAIERSERRGSISAEDMKKVIELMGRLYNDLYKAYPEFKETNDMVDDILLTYSEEAALEARRDEKVHFAQYLIQEGWASEKIVEATKLDLGTVESLMGAAHA